MQFDIEEIYPLVSKDLLLNVIIKQKVLLISAMTKQKPLCTQENFLFQQCRYVDKKGWCQRFDVSQGSFDGAGIFRIGLYRNDGLA